MMSLPLRMVPVLLLACLIQPRVAFSLVLGQIDTFEDGTTQNWVVGLLGAPSPAPPVNISSGGPAGIDDNFLQLSAIGGGGPGSKLTVINISQWSGDFIAAGVGAIRMNVNNTGTTDLSLRLLFDDASGGPPSNLAFSTNAIFVPAGSGWTTIVFPIQPADLSAGIGSVATALMNASELRLFHSPSAMFPGPAVIATLGVDNIQALGSAATAAVPVMSLATLALLVAALGVTGSLRRGELG